MSNLLSIKDETDSVGVMIGHDTIVIEETETISCEANTETQVAEEEETHELE